MVTLGAAALADIQAPPCSQQTPFFKLGRGFSNILYGVTEIPYSIACVNDDLGNNAAGSWGVIRGVQRSVVRFGAGVYDVFTFPCPTYKNSYRSVLPPLVPWLHNGYTEFPPELGFESRLNYVREYRPY